MPEDEQTDPPEPETDDRTEPETDEETGEEPGDDETRKHRSPKHPAHASRQAAKYRVQRNEARRERDEARLELAFTKAAGGRFVNAEAAFKCADRELLSMDPDGTPVGLDESIEGLIEANPFLLTPDAEPPKKETDPFETPQRSSGRVMNGPRKTKLNTDLNRAALEAKYPALRR